MRHRRHLGGKRPLVRRHRSWRRGRRTRLGHRLGQLRAWSRGCRAGLRPEPLAAMLRTAGFSAIQTGSIAAIRRQQRRAAPFPRSLTVGVYDDFWLTATKPTG